jgi:hypothetical protein
MLSKLLVIRRWKVPWTAFAIGSRTGGNVPLLFEAPALNRADAAGKKHRSGATPLRRNRPFQHVSPAFDESGLFTTE